MGKKKQKVTANNHQDDLDSEENQMMKELEEFNSDQSWSELDELQQHLFNGSHEESSPEDLPKRVRRKDLRKQREEEIAEYQEALKAMELENKIFIPSQKVGKMNLNLELYLKMINEAINRDVNCIGVSRMLGLKSTPRIKKQKLRSHFEMIVKYLKESILEKGIEDDHDYLLKTTGNSVTRENEDKI